ncbi:MAG: hypothetical protein G8345_22000 [Magnetococcales bacterium]|nr:hypothetical protein [Magnetococcales bacterium]NGZ29549.1 hypothetical protein [Magnetococcales bacterium]
MPWEYDPGENRTKHKGGEEAGFLPETGRNKRGQCPQSITHHPTLAWELLNTGVPWPPETATPEAIYNVHEGVVYRAEATVPGKSYHGFPECEQPGRKVPDSVLLELARRSDQSGHYRQFKKWMKLYLPDGWNSLSYQPKNHY